MERNCFCGLFFDVLIYWRGISIDCRFACWSFDYFLTTKAGIFVPKNIRTLEKQARPVTTGSFVKSLLPYVLLIFLLIGGKFVLGSVKIPLLGVVFIH